MAEVIQIFNPKSGERRNVYTVDARELLKGDNTEGWVVFDAMRHGAIDHSVAPATIVSINSGAAPREATPNLGAASADFPAATRSAGFAAPVDKPKGSKTDF